jgi:hypothetical protein
MRLGQSWVAFRDTREQLKRPLMFSELHERHCGTVQRRRMARPLSDAALEQCGSIGVASSRLADLRG